MFETRLPVSLETSRLRVAGIVIGLCVALTPFALAQRGDSASASAGEEGGESGDDEIAVPSLIGGSVGGSDDQAGVLTPGRGPIADWLWDLPRLVDDPDAPFLQRLRIVGRYHGQYAYVDSNHMNQSGWDNRRFRMGVNAKFLQDFTLQSVWKLDGDAAKGDKDNIDNQWISWRHWEQFGLKVGQQKPLWSQEWSTSSNSILTFERSLLVNQLRPQQSLGVYASGALGSWAYGAGWFWGALGESDPSDDGNFAILSVARDFGDWFALLDDARWRVDYLYNNDSEQAGSGEYDHGLSTGISGKMGRWRWTTEVLYATGGENADDVFGVILMPSYDIIDDRLQFVLRYQFATSDGDHLQLQNRYETVGVGIGDASGDRYNALYGGLNWYLRGNRLKFMTGVEYAKMRDQDNNGGNYKGWTLFSGVRLSF